MRAMHYKVSESLGNTGAEFNPRATVSSPLTPCKETRSKSGLEWVEKGGWSKLC